MIRQQVLVLWLANSALDAAVLGWSFYDGTDGAGPQLGTAPPYPNGLAALIDGWQLLQMSQLIPAAPGQERDVAFLKHEFVFHRLIDLSRAS